MVAANAFFMNSNFSFIPLTMRYLLTSENAGKYSTQIQNLAFKKRNRLKAIQIQHFSQYPHFRTKNPKKNKFS